MTEREQAPGTRRYRIGDVLGQGGFGTVYRADLFADGGFTKAVALKVLHEGSAAAPTRWPASATRPACWASSATARWSRSTP
ncbi:MAG: hypothetical protein R3F59_14345 [Myxococcota bacterium]